MADNFENAILEGTISIEAAINAGFRNVLKVYIDQSKKEKRDRKITHFISILKSNNIPFELNSEYDFCMVLGFTESSIEYRTVENIGYIKITDFNSATTEQFKTAVDELKKQQVSAVIFDIRNNIGGLTSVCGDMLDEILGEGTAIRAKYKNGDIKPLESTTDGEWDIPMAVLTNGETASSAELFALAIRDYEKGILVGEKTYGKGVMQTSYTLNDGSAVKLTTAVLVDKNGETYNKIGITPDIEVAQSDYAKKYQNFLKDEDDTQLYKAIEQLKKSS